MFAEDRSSSRGKNPLALRGGRLYSETMILRPILCLLLVALFAGCDTPYKKADAEEKQPLKDQSKDQSFQAFVGRLRIAVAKKDRPMLTTMMTSDFGYRWDDPPPGESVFDYWDQQNVWPEVAAILKQKFEPHDLYMVAPPEVVTDPNYAGYRAGMRLAGGSWKFAYFVPGAPAE